MLTGIVRTALMTSPMFAYTAPTPRTGKSLLVDIACILSHGHVAPVIVASSTFEERDKQLQAALAGGDTIVALDNQNSDEALTSDALSQMLTQPIVKVRPFGQNKEMLEYPSMSVISVTGNNLAVAKDLTERTVLCQVDAKMEVPGSRKFTFNLLSWRDKPSAARSRVSNHSAGLCRCRPPAARLQSDGWLRGLERMGSLGDRLAEASRSMRNNERGQVKGSGARRSCHNYGALGAGNRLRCGDKRNRSSKVREAAGGEWPPGLQFRPLDDSRQERQKPPHGTRPMAGKQVRRRHRRSEIRSRRTLRPPNLSARNHRRGNS